MFKPYKNHELGEIERKNLRSTYISPSGLNAGDSAIVMKLLGYEVEEDICTPAMRRGITQEKDILKLIGRTKNILTFYNAELKMFFNPDSINYSNKTIWEIKSTTQDKDIQHFAKVYNRQCLAYHLATGYKVILVVYYHEQNKIKKWEYNWEPKERSSLKRRINHLNDFVSKNKQLPLDKNISDLAKLRSQRKYISKNITALEKLIDFKKESKE